MPTVPTKELHGLALDPRMPQVGHHVAQRYQILETLGIGGFAVVYRARDVRLGGEVALKVLEPEKSASPDFVTRFQQEINLVRQLRHHNTIKIWDAGLTDQGCLYMASELVDGEELSELIAREGGLPVGRVKRLVGQVLRSLAEAHKAGIVHRDLKPSNIMVAQLEGEPDYVKVVDFGIAKALTPELSMVKTQTGVVMCTPAYASPEVLRSQNVGPHSDLYALGLIMIELLTGHQAVQGQSQVDIMVKQIDAAPVEVPQWLAQTPIGRVVSRAVAKPLEQRYGDAMTMLAELDAVPDHPLNRPVGAAAPAQFGPPPSAPTAWPPAPSPSTPAPSPFPTAQAMPPPAPPSAWSTTPSPVAPSAQTLLASSAQTRPEPTVARASTSSKLPWILALAALLAAGAFAFALLSRHGNDPQPDPTGPGGLAEGSAEEPGVTGPSSLATGGPTAGSGPIAVRGDGETGASGPVGPVTSGTGLVAAAGPSGATTGLPAPQANLPQGVTQTPHQPAALPGDAPATLRGALGLPTATGPVAVNTPPQGPPRQGSVPVELPHAPTGVVASTGVVAPTGSVAPTGAVAPTGIMAPTGIAAPTGVGAPTGIPAPTGRVAVVQTPPAGPFVYRVVGSPERVRLNWRYADEDDADWSHSERCNRPCVVEVPTARPIEVRLRKSNYCSETFTLTPDAAHGPWELVLEEGCFERNVMCYNSCQWAHDGECDDGGPGSLYAVCTFGTDCADCGPRHLGR